MWPTEERLAIEPIFTDKVLSDCWWEGTAVEEEVEVEVEGVLGWTWGWGWEWGVNDALGLLPRLGLPGPRRIGEAST